MLEYVLEINDLTQTQEDFMTQVINVTSYTQSDIADRIIKIAAVLEAEKQVVADIIAEGGSVSTKRFNPFFNNKGIDTQRSLYKRRLYTL